MPDDVQLLYVSKFWKNDTFFLKLHFCTAPQRILNSQDVTFIKCLEITAIFIDRSTLKRIVLMR